MIYRLIDKVFSGSGSVGSAAEAHGLATGMLCVNPETQSHFWLKQLFAEDEMPNEEQGRVLVRLFDEVKASLAGDDFDFDPFLPDDDAELEERLTAFCSWCEGFLYGVGAVAQTGKPSPQAREILQDITEFTKLDTNAGGEEDEMAFMEISEYLRTAVLLLRAEFGSRDRPRIH